MNMQIYTYLYVTIFYISMNRPQYWQTDVLTSQVIPRSSNRSQVLWSFFLLDSVNLYNCSPCRTVITHDTSVGK
jgi:hypothetical protein